jgi:hypothetical protein
MKKNVEKIVWWKNDLHNIVKRLNHYRNKMFLNEWLFDVRLDGWFCKDDGTEDRTVAANTEVLFEYKKAMITFFITSKKEWGKGWRAIDEIIKHELAHSVTDRLTKLAEERFLSQREIDKECEVLTQYIANCVNSDYQEKNVRRHKTKRGNKGNKVLAKPKK